MLNDNKELKNNELNNKELPEGVTELSMEDLEQVTGGAGPNVTAYPGGSAGLTDTVIKEEAVLISASFELGM